MFYEPSFLSRSVRPPQFPSSSDTRQAVAETIFKIKFIPDYPGELPPTTALAHTKVKRNLKTVVGYPGPTSGGGPAEWETYSLYKSIGPNVMMTMNIPASSQTGYLRTDQTGDPFQAPVNTLEYLPFGFVQDSNGDWYGTQAYAVVFDMRAKVSSSAMYTIAGASAYARVDFKIVQIDNQVIDPNF